MAAICAATCGIIQNPPSTYFDCADETRNFGFKHFVLIKCDYQFTDILDSAEWEAAVANGDVKIGPPGSLVINPATANSFEIEGCGREITGEATFTVDFTTYQFGKFTTANVPDSVMYWRDVFKNSVSYRMMMPDCHNTLPLFFMDDGWMDAISGGAPATVPSANPGFEFSVTTLPNWSAGQERLGVWTTQFTIKKVGIMEAALLPGVFEVLA